ncbi:hypothetical protein GWI33_014512 [Rhynchophorus ferrugineus]|uniref:Uncharacterized protein n=1 Tax=Rhynchophorus ferrugineus TaxID=354439 RepID=A0A834I1A5_RHYFE|nr:hypothetical protein GWI33_014512 [Rhynchophorus ferrugineus]
MQSMTSPSLIRKTPPGTPPAYNKQSDSHIKRLQYLCVETNRYCTNSNSVRQLADGRGTATRCGGQGDWSGSRPEPRNKGPGGRRSVRDALRRY